MEIVSYSEARKHGLMYYFTGKSCVNGHIAKRRSCCGNCIECVVAYKNRHPEKNRIRVQKWRDENPERARRTAREGQKKYCKTTKGQLRKFCRRASTRLSYGKSYKSQRSLLDYTPEQFEDHLIRNTEFSSIAEAMMSNYHLDHIVPISYISDIIKDEDLQFRVAMDLKNLRLIPAKVNFEKKNKINTSEIQIIISYLFNKYNINV